ERLLAARVAAVRPVEADLELREAAPARLVLGRLDALDQGVAGAVVRAVGGVLRDRQVDLVGHLDGDDARVRPEAVHDRADEPDPGRDVALLSRIRVVPELELGSVARGRALPRDVDEAADAGLAV